MYLAIILFVGLLLRVAALLVWADTPFWSIPVADEAIYHEWATQIDKGEYAPQEAYEFSPLPAYFYAVLYRIAGPSLLVVRISNIILSLIICLFIALIAHQLSGERVALLSAIISALYKPYVFYSVTLMKTTLAVFMFSLFVLCLLHVIYGRRRNLWFFLLGLSSVLCLHTRGNFIVLIPVGFLACISLFFWKKNEVRSLCYSTLFFVVGVSLPLGVVILRNAEYSDQIVLSTTQGGFNFYLGNHHYYEAPYSRPVPFAQPSPEHQGTHFTIEASRHSNRPLSRVEASRFWYHEALKEMIADPVASLKKTGWKCLAVFNGQDYCDHFNISYLGHIISPLKIPLPTFALLFPFGMAGLLMNLRDKRTCWLLITGALYAITLVIFFTNGRYRLPLTVLLIPGAAVGLCSLAADLRRRRSYLLFVRYAVLLGLFLLLVLLPIPGSRALAPFHNMYGVILDITGKKNEAQAYWEKSILENSDFSPFASIELAKEAARRNQYDKAEYYLSLIPEGSFAEAQKLALLGQIRVRQHRFAEAVALLRASLKINTGDLPVRHLLIQVLQIMSPVEAKDEIAEQQRMIRFYKGF